MAISVRDLLKLQHLGLVLRVEGAPGALDAPVHWVHQSDLSDSTLFTEPGEVLMTTGTHLPKPADIDPGEMEQLCDQYVQRLHDTSVVGLGFGVGVYHDDVPGALLAAATRHGLPLFEIPWEVPFSAVIKAVSKSRSDAEHAYLRRTNTAQRRLIAAVGRENVIQSVVSSTSQIIGGWAALADADGRLRVHTHTNRLATVQEAIVRHVAAGNPVTFWDAPDCHVVAFTLVRGDGLTHGILVAGTAEELDPLAISTCTLATNLLGVYLALSGRVESALAGVRGLVVEEALHGAPEIARRAGGSLWPKTPREPIGLTCVSGPATELDRLEFGALPAMWGRVDDKVWVIAAAAHQPRVAARIQGCPGLVSACAAPFTWQELPQARAQVLGALLEQDLPRQVPLIDLLGPQLEAAFVRSRLGPLLEPGAAELLATLRVWVCEDGRIDRAAEVLGVHRHTVGRRMRLVSERLGADLDSPRVRHELWFACQALERDESGPGGREPAQARPAGSAPVSRAAAQNRPGGASGGA